MRKITASLLLAIPAFLGSPVLLAAEKETPIITFHTNIYNTYGPSNAFHITLGATEPTYYEIDYGYGPIEEEVGVAIFDSEAGGMVGTEISMSANENGIVKIYGDASKIDYVDFEGCYISDIEWPTLTNVEILNLKHNEFEALDLSHMTKLAAVYVDDNPCRKETPFILGYNHPNLTILSMHTIDWVDPDFDISHFPQLRSCIMYGCPTIDHLTPSACPGLLQLSIDGTSIADLDVSKNKNLLILNVSETHMTSIDVSGNPYLTELYAQHEATYNGSYKLSSLDVSKNPELVRLYVNGNNLTELDLSHNPKINSLGCRRNKLTSISFENNPAMALVDISKNYMNFNTMPTPDEVLGDYTYEQYPLEMKRSYAVGTVIDFTDQVIRKDGSETYAAMFAVNRDNPGEPQMLDEEYFFWDNGKLTLQKSVPSDSVYMAFYNPIFPDCDLKTIRFMVKESADMNLPKRMISFAVSSIVDNIELYIGARGATPETPVKFTVDPGNGELLEFTATTTGLPDAPNVVTPRRGSQCIVYADEYVDITALKMKDMRLTAPVDIEGCPLLRHLSVTGCNLTSIDMMWNSCLETIDLSNNRLSNVYMGGANQYYSKTKLKDVNLSNNSLTGNMSAGALETLDVSNNKLTGIDTFEAWFITSMNISNNEITELTLNDCTSLEVLDASNNFISELYIPAYCPWKKINISGNSFAMPDLTMPGFCEEYIYAPQRPMQLSKKAPTANLSKQYMDVDGQTSTFEWHYAADGSLVPEGYITPNGNEGKFVFTNPDTGLVYCVIYNPAYPDFTGENAFRTTDIMTAPKPTNVIATLTPCEDEHIEYVLRANDLDGNPRTEDETEIYVDWKGDGDLEQIVLNQTNLIGSGEGVKDAQIRFYTYDENSPLAIFSFQGKFNECDGSKLNDAIGFYVSDFVGPIENLKIPETEALQELAIVAPALTQFDASKTPNLITISLVGNIKQLDLSPLKQLAVASLSGNKGIKVKFDNPKMWELRLTNSELEEIDLSGLPGMQQLWLGNNKLSHIDVSGMPYLRVLSISGNCFDINTLPLPKDSWFRYDCNNQAVTQIEEVDGRVDLSKYASRDGVETEYTWFVDYPYLNEYNILDGESLIIDEEYKLENGVTTFLTPIKNVMCVMTNSLLPGFYQCTNFIDVKTAGVEDVKAEIENGDAEYYDLQGVRVDNPSYGIYIRRQGNSSTKVFIGK